MEIRDWEEKYYRETNAEDRKALLDERNAEGEETQELALINRLFEARYVPEAKENANIDHMLRGMMNIKFAQPKKGLFSKGADKQLKEIYRDLGKEIADEYGETGRRVWYRELKNLGYTFLELCKDDRNYSSFLWGLGKMKDATLKNKLAADIYVTACEKPAELGAAEELSVFTAAITDAYYEMFPKDRESLEKLING